MALNLNISVIVTAYNSEKYIRRSLTSVLAQTYTDFELIVVNDGSSDETKNIIESEFPKAILINKKNGGPSSSRNAGINAATGGYIAFLDADDYWDSNKLEKQVSIIQNPDVMMVCTNAINVSNNKELGLKFDHKKVFLCDKQEGFVDNYIRNSPRYAFHLPSSWLVKKELFLKYGFFDENLISVEDSEIIIRWYMNNEKIYYINDPYVYYEVSNDESLTKNLKQWSTNNFKYWITYQKIFEDRPEKNLFENMVKKTLLISTIRSTVIGRESRHARKLLLQYKYNLFSTLWILSYFSTYLPLYRLRKIKRYIKKR
jgi:glycosyltransferase involved in cell wall biosynthesis